MGIGPESVDFGEPPEDWQPIDEPPDDFERQVQRQLRQLRVRDAAQKAFAAENQPAPKPLDVGSLGEVMARPLPATDRIEGLAPWEGSTLITAQRKTGKTTLAGNLARSLITGEPFLTRFEVRALEGNLAFLNYEVSGFQLARWLTEMGADPQRVLLANLRGQANPVASIEDRAQLAAYLRAHDVEALIVDPFARAFTGEDQNNAGQVTRFLCDLEQFARSEVGARDLFLTNHAGWNGERSRGSTALEDWPDALWRIVRPADDDGGPRYFSAFGRDVEVSEDQLEFDPQTRRLSLSGNGSRKQATAARKQDDLVAACVRVVKLMPGVKVSSLEEQLRVDGYRIQRGDGSRAARAAVDAGLLRMEMGPRGAKRFHLATVPEHSRDFPGEVVEYSPPLLIGEGTTQEGSPPTFPRTGTASDAGQEVAS